uniref:Histone domain-containing protein n=1 Tax=Rhabditophanes sp. KR3021 TaxID=114890 RepID=A0AC35UAV2_9BILA
MRPIRSTEGPVNTAYKSRGVEPQRRIDTSKILRTTARKSVADYIEKPKRSTIVRKANRLTNSREKLIPKAPIARLFKEVMDDYTQKSNFRITREALEVIRTATEEYLVSFFEQCNILAVHAKRVTVMPKDIATLKELWKYR